MAPEAARRQAVLEFGGREQIKEELRDVHRVSLVETAITNLKSTFRFIRKSPSFSLAVILTLAIGIGANSAVFSALDAILFKPLLFPNGDQLMHLTQTQPKVKSPNIFVAPVGLEEWNNMNSTFQAITGYVLRRRLRNLGRTARKIDSCPCCAPLFASMGSCACSRP
jgi:putative ABC transport system permease protein